MELCAPAVEDARRNAEENGVTDSTFVASKAEDVMRTMLEQKGLGSVVAVVDPPRSGLANSVIKALRRCRAVTRLVYVSCNPEGSFIEDAVKLTCFKGSHGGQRFVPLKAACVDMFPGTRHTELVMQFGRPEISEETSSGAAVIADAQATQDGSLQSVGE